MNIGRKFTLLIIASLAVAGAVSLYLFGDFIVTERAERLESLGSMAGSLLEESLSNYMRTRDSDSLERALNDIRKIDTVDRILIANDKGIIKAGTDKEVVGMKLTVGGEWPAGLSRHEMGTFLKGGGTFRWVQGILNKPECHKCHSPGNTYNGVIVLDFSTKALHAQLGRHILQGTGVILAAVIFIGLALSLFSRSLIEKRLNRVISQIRKFKEGRQTERVSVGGNDEITRLQENFFEMAEAIRISENRLRTIIETEPECVKLLSAEGAVLEMNPAGLAMVEADSPDQVIGKSMGALATPEYRPALGELTKDIFRGNNGMLEFEIVGMKGTHRWLETYAVPLRDAKNEIFALLGVTRDITQRKKAEEEIGRNLDTRNVINTLLQVSLENVPLEKILDRTLDTVLSIPWLALESRGGIFLVDEDAPDTLQMKSQKRLSPYLLEECSSIPFGRCLCGRAASTKELQFADTIDGRHEIHYADMAPHGHYCVPIIFSDKVLGVISLYLSEGHRRNEREVSFLNAIANVLAGILQRKRVEDERETLITDLQLTLSKVSHSQRMWQETFDSIGDMISIHDGDFNIIKVNRAFASYFNLPPAGVIDKKCYEFFHSGGAPAANCPHLTTMRDGVPATTEYQDPGTRKIFLVSTFPFFFHDANFHGSIHIAKDITEEREKEMRLIMSERLAALGQMASGIAHEINNPLATIAGCAEGLLGRVKGGNYDPELFENYLRIIEEEIMRCKGITTGMLSFVRKSTYERHAFSLDEIIDKTIELIGFQGRLRNIEVVKSYADDMPAVEGNEGELRQVILIIIMNALDAMRDSGRLHVYTGMEGRTAFLKVTDSGTGIPSENLSKIFDPFFTTKSDTGGTGLGLSIANKIVLSHGGAIYATSEEGRGSTFKIVLPLS